jgi:hypothetical protein
MPVDEKVNEVESTPEERIRYGSEAEKLLPELREWTRYAKRHRDYVLQNLRELQQ